MYGLDGTELRVSLVCSLSHGGWLCERVLKPTAGSWCFFVLGVATKSWLVSERVSGINISSLRPRFLAGVTYPWHRTR
ncbi:uncharacterized protein J3R85_019886 [Psidium guajava]|nr:uncharacterized protein J3R85_019886 [Psidium guajava]